MLELVNLSKSFDNKNIFTSFSYSFEDCGLYILKGESGSGKSTLLNLISGQVKNDSGFINYPSNINNIYEDISFIFQENNLFENLTLIENINLIFNFKKIKKDLNKIDEILSFLNILDLKNNKVNTFSTGEKQRGSIAIALLSDAKIILADEIVSNLDEENKNIILSILEKISKSKLVIFATHDETIINKYNNNLIDLDKKDKYQTKIEKNFIKRNDKKIDISFYESLYIEKSIMKKQKIRLIFSFFILFLLLFSLMYSFSFKCLTLSKLTIQSIENNNIDSFIVFDYKFSDKKKDNYDTTMYMVTNKSLSSSDFPSYKGYNYTIANYIILNNSLNEDEVILTDYSLNLLKEYNIVSFDNLSSMKGKTLNINNNIVSIKDINYTNYKDYGEQNLYDNTRYYYSLCHMSRNTFLKLYGYHNIDDYTINGQHVYTIDKDLKIQDDEIYLNKTAICKIFNTTDYNSYIDSYKDFTFQTSYKNTSKTVNLKIKLLDFDSYGLSYITLSDKTNEILFDSFDGYITDSIIDFATYITNYNSKKLNSIVKDVYKNNGSFGYLNYFDVYSLYQIIKSNRLTFEILSYILIAVSFILITYIVYSMHITNKDNIKKLKVYGLSNLSLYKIFNSEFFMQLCLSSVISIILTVFLCKKFDREELTIANISSLNIFVIICSILFILLIILLCNLVPFIFDKKAKKISKL